MFFDKEYVIIKKDLYNPTSSAVTPLIIKLVFWWMRGVKKVVIMSVIRNL